MAAEKEKICDICDTSYVERNNYYPGKLLTARDYVDEQNYFNKKRWLINRTVNGWGVVCGLDVERVLVESNGQSQKENGQKYDETKVIVKPGLAIDCCGREILVCNDVEVEIPPENPVCNNKEGDSNDKKNESNHEQGQQHGQEPKKEEISKQDRGERKYIICIEYHECKAEPVYLPPIACDEAERCEFNRIRDSYRIKAIPIKSEDDICDSLGEYCSLQKLSCFTEKEYNDFLSEHDCAEEILSGINETKGETICIKYWMITDEMEEKLGDKALGKIKQHLNSLTALHKHLCDKLRYGCQKCPECLCVVLGVITINPGCDPTIEVNQCSKRRLVYNNTLLYDLIHCFHKDAPHVEDISWKHNKDMTWEEFVGTMNTNGGDPSEKINGRLKLTFDHDMRHETINENTFLVDAILIDVSTCCSYSMSIPGEIVQCEKNKREFYFIPKTSWCNANTVKDCNSILKSEGGKIVITLKGDFILDKCGIALDGNFIGGKLPSGNGVEGCDFYSWFTVSPECKQNTAK